MHPIMIVIPPIDHLSPLPPSPSAIRNWQFRRFAIEGDDTGEACIPQVLGVRLRPEVRLQRRLPGDAGDRTDG